MPEKPPTSYRLSDECKQLLRAAAEKRGLKAADMIEIYTREGCERDGVKLPKKKGGPK